MPDASQTFPVGSDVLEHRILPGQLWKWALEFGDGWWPWQRVTTVGRMDVDSSFETVRNGDLFMVIVVDDPGPWTLPEFNENGVIIPANVHRWHVVLLHGVLCWVQHSWFKVSELACDVS